MNSNMIQQLKTLIQAQDEEMVISLITDQPKVLGEKDENGTSGLLLIAYSGLPTALKVAKSLKKSFSFHESIVCGEADQVINRIEKNPELINSYSNDGFTPIALATFFNHTAIAQWMLSNGGDPSLPAHNPSKVTALHSAVARENIELVKAFLKFGVDVNTPQMQGVTALHSAVHRGNIELVKILIENGADMNLKMDSGNSSMDIAENEGFLTIVEYFNSKKIKFESRV